MTSKQLNKEYRTIIVLDNDECLGAWSLGSAIQSLFSSYVPNNTGIPISDCMKTLQKAMVKYYLSNGGARPGTKETLRLIKFYKDTGIIDKVVMFTSANNKYNWVNFLKNCLEEYAGVKGLYDAVLHRDNTKLSFSVDGSTLKCMNVVCTTFGFQEEKTSVIVIDDKPHNIRGECTRIAVSPYRHIIDEKHINDIIDDVIDNLQKMYKPNTKQGCEQHKTFSPEKLRNIIKDSLLVDKNGRKQDLQDNLNIHHCSCNQLDDKNLIENSVKAFLYHLAPIQLVRTLTNPITISPPQMKRSVSI